MSTSLKPRFAFAFPTSFSQMEREMDQLFGRFLGDGNEAREATIGAPADFWEEEGKWSVEMELPGVRQEDIDVTLEKSTLRISAERHAPKEQHKYWHQERGYGRIERIFNLPETVDPEGIEAELRDGVLRLTLAKKPEAQPKKIEIKQVRTA